MQWCAKNVHVSVISYPLSSKINSSRTLFKISNLYSNLYLNYFQYFNNSKRWGQQFKNMTDESSPWLGATRETIPIRPRSNFHFYGFETSLTISEKVIVSYVCIPGKHICLRNLIILVKKKILKRTKQSENIFQQIH